ncbi:FHA domain-containing protein [Rhodopirellula europaea]|uniref:FHA domain-containing protein n=1 Tax=Rhodopirellula europaea TaxID=1263866 RepID=UPI003D2E68C2
MLDPGVKRWTIGRDPASDLVIEHFTIAFEHAVIEKRQNEYWVVPLNGKVALSQMDAKTIAPDAFSTSAAMVTAKTSVWLSPRIRLPWPFNDESIVRLTIGRAADCDVVIQDDSVSGRHAFLHLDQHAGVILFDNDSRNGLFIGSGFKERVRAIVLQPEGQVRFGSKPVESSFLLSAIKKRQTMDSTEPQKLSSQRKHTSVIVLASLAGLMAVLVASFCFFSVSDQIAQQGDPTRYQDQSQNAMVTVETLNTDSVVKNAPTLEPRESANVSIEDMVYWLVITDVQSGKVFRLGTAFATVPGRWITTASVVKTMDELTSSGFANPKMIGILNGDHHDVQASQVQEDWPSKARLVSEATRTHETLVQRIAKGGWEPEEGKKRFDSSVETLAMRTAEATLANIGHLTSGLTETMESSEAIDHWTSSSVEVGQSVQAFHGGILLDDAQILPDGEHNVKGVDFRVVAEWVPKSTNLRSKLIELQLEREADIAIARNYNWLGVPLTRNGVLVAIMVEQPPLESTDNSDAIWSAIFLPDSASQMGIRP